MTIVPTTDDAVALWDLWVGRGGGEGIVLKDEAIGVQALDGDRHRGVKIAPALPLEARVGHVVGLGSICCPECRPDWAART